MTAILPKLRVRCTLVLTVAALPLAGCATGGSIPAAGTPITQSEAQLGAQNDPQIIAEYGGSYEGPQTSYVRQIGQKIAVQSGLANSPTDFKVTLLNSPVNNAFAIPGGYVYVTRNLVGLMNNEAELAAVLGHEVGHVAARHSAQRQAATQRNSILGALGSVVAGAVLGNTAAGQLGQQAFQTGSQLLTLRYSRSQETEADQLGIAYLNRAGYDPHAMATLLADLAAQTALDAQLQGRDSGGVPAWASTHPDPASRVREALARAGGATGATNREVFLQRVDGLLYGDDPKQGVIDGRQFTHPDFRLTFTAPDGYYLVNGADAVTVGGGAGQAQFSTAAYTGNLQTYVGQVLSSLGGGSGTVQPQAVQTTTVNGLPAAYTTVSANSGNQTVDVTVFAYQFGSNQAYHFAAITPRGQAGVFNPMFQSVRRISASAAAQVTPRRIDVVTVGANDTVATLARRMAYSDGQEARFRVLNGMGSTDNVAAGQKVKIVVRAAN